MSKSIGAAVCVALSITLAGCHTGAVTPAATASPTTPTLLPPSANTALAPTPPPPSATTEPALTPTVTSTPIITATPLPTDPADLLQSAVARLQNAASFELSAHEVRAYQAITADGENKQVYGAFDTHYAVIRRPALKVHAHRAYRYDPQAVYIEYDTYTYQQEGNYVTLFVENAVTSTKEIIDLQHIEPLGGDVYQTLVNYYDQARWVSESDGEAVYVLEHPKWYTLRGAIGFADLGLLHAHENGEKLIEQYVAQHYPNVATIVFTITVLIDEALITRVEVDDRDFMNSLWAEIDRALLEQGADPASLNRYVTMDEHGISCRFSNYNQVQDFDIPR